MVQHTFQNTAMPDGKFELNQGEFFFYSLLSDIFVCILNMCFPQSKPTKATTMFEFSEVFF